MTSICGWHRVAGAPGAGVDWSHRLLQARAASVPRRIAIIGSGVPFADHVLVGPASDF